MFSSRTNHKSWPVNSIVLWSTCCLKEFPPARGKNQQAKRSFVWKCSWEVCPIDRQEIKWKGILLLFPLDCVCVCARARACERAREREREREGEIRKRCCQCKFPVIRSNSSDWGAYRTQVSDRCWSPKIHSCPHRGRTFSAYREGRVSACNHLWISSGKGIRFCLSPFELL